MLKLMMLIVVVISASETAFSQAIPAASSTREWEVGANYLFGYPDYSPQKAYGFGVFVDYDFTRNYGVGFDYHRADISQHPDTETSYEFSARYRRTYGHAVPYFRGFAGYGVYTFGPLDHSSPNEGFTAAQGGNTTGYALFGFAGGLDVLIGEHLSARVEADYQDWLAAQNLGNGLTPILYTVGIGYHSGGAGRHPSLPEMSCRAVPSDVFPGDVISVESNTVNVREPNALTYTWASSGGVIQSTKGDASVEVGTSNLAPGEYVVKGHLLKKRDRREVASCEAPFTVRPFEPPTIACSANPSTVPVGSDIAISATGRSPQNRPLLYSFATTGGTLRTTGSNAFLSTSGVSAGSVTITCNVTDDLGKSASSTVSVAMLSESHTTTRPLTLEPLCSVSFARDLRRPARVDNEGKACLDDIGLDLKTKIDAHLVIIGNATTTEASVIASQRAMNVKQYLVKELNIDPSRIEMRTGSDSDKIVRTVLVPLGATFDDTHTQIFKEDSVVRSHDEAYPIHRRKVQP